MSQGTHHRQANAAHARGYSVLFLHRADRHLHTEHRQDLRFSFHQAMMVYIFLMAARHRMTQNNVAPLVEDGLLAVEGNR